MSNHTLGAREAALHQPQERYERCQILLGRLQKALCMHGYWSEERPDAQALASDAPFCCDTLRFEQWLQFVFIPRMQLLLGSQDPLPSAMCLSPMAEISWGQQAPPSLMALLHEIDRLFQEDE